MNDLKIHNSKNLGIHEKMRKNIFGKILLWVVSLFYLLAIFIRKSLYDMGFLKTRSVSSRVVCIGNLTAGGTGKTTAVMKAAQLLSQARMSVAIVSRGYKRKTSKKETIILSDETSNTWENSGDEPFMLYKSLSEHKVPVVISSNRYLATQTAIKQFRSQVVLMDDGFQHHALDRDADIVLLDARNPFGGNSLLPLGMMREPKSALNRADLIIVTHANMVNEEQIGYIKHQVHSKNPDVKILLSAHEPEHYFDICNNKTVLLNQIKGPVTVLSAIGDPKSFEKTLEGLGAKPEQIWRYPDHHPYTMEELKSAQHLRKGMPIITTYKDFTKFPENWREVLDKDVYVLSIQFKILGEKEDFNTWANTLFPGLADKLNQAS
jgi:tetraacyldisaccharide 4'-kinase